MTAPAAFAATFSDFKLIKGRKVAQVVLEVPLEQADNALAALGGLPRPDAEKWVGVALMTGPPVSEPEKPGKRRFEELPYSQQAALKCGDEAFQRYLAERFNSDPKWFDEETTAKHVRSMCRVRSRADIKPGTVAGTMWEDILYHFHAWLREPEHVG